MTDNTKTEDTEAAQPSIIQLIYSSALHRKVLIVFVADIPVDADGVHHVLPDAWNGQWTAYCVPVEGRDHEEEKHTWPKVGVKVSEELARVVNGAVVEEYENMGLSYRA